MKKQRKIKAFKWKPFSKKQLQILTWWCPDSPVKDYNGIIADGAVRSGKTVAMSISFALWAMKSFNEQNFALCGKTIGSLRRNVIKILKQQLISRDYEVEEKRSENLLIVSKGKVTNFFYTFGGKDESSQDLIQGMTLAGVLFDEVALMPQSFVEQAEARCSVEGSKLWYNCNPKGPSHYFKTEYIDDGNLEKKKLLYLHFTMDDNLTLSEAIKERYRNQFKGVFYERNILGLWVTAEGKIYISFTKDNVIDRKQWYERDKDGKYIHPLRKNILLCTIGVDFGGNGSSTAFTCTAFTKGFRECVTVKEKRIKHDIDPAELEKLFVAFVKECQAEYPVRTAYCDSAEQILIRGLRRAAVKSKLAIDIKNARKGEIIDRIRFGLTMFAQNRFFILSDCKETIQAYNDAVWEDKKEDVRLDDGTTNIDSIDSSEYSQEPFMKTMIDLG
ncbi:MAG: PBSX family phage terminase large subunit [Acutalibacteraceae bacterium]|nr:PBSX family phage terminase large subunit [Acutalibacteraceae bacterium]